jgi:hypothetical protein
MGASGGSRFLSLRYAIPVIFWLTIRPLSVGLRAQETTTVGGYGELHYNEPDGSARGTLDLHRFVIYLGHSFNENLTFKSEVEIEHTKIEATETGGATGGEVAVEQAYLDWHFNNQIGLKAGLILLPIGIINQLHEPPTFNGVERPNFDDVIIPTTWREAGGGIYGSFSQGVSYQLYVVAGLRAGEFNGTEGIREGRQEGLESSAGNPSLTGRLETVPVLGLKLAGSFFLGNTSDGNDALGDATLSVLCGDIQYSLGQFSGRAEGALEHLSNTEQINDTFAPFPRLASRMHGYYLEGAYNVLPFFSAETDQLLNLFGRYERFNTQADFEGTVSLLDPDGRNDREEITVGATFKPTYNTAFKADYQFFNNQAGLNTKQLNLGVAYSF